MGLVEKFCKFAEKLAGTIVMVEQFFLLATARLWLDNFRLDIENSHNDLEQKNS